MYKDLSKDQVKKIIKLVLFYTIILVILLTILFPIYWLIITSIKMPIEWFNDPPILIPSKLFLETYKEIVSNSDFKLALTNSIIVSLLGTGISLLIGSAVAYSLANINFRFNRTMLVWIILNRMIPPVTIIIPYFLIMHNLHLLDTIGGLIITRIFTSFPFVVWMMLGFFKTVPKEINEAAKIDGCDFYQRFIKIGIPLAKTGIAVASIFTFIGAWNELLFTLTISSQRTKTIPVLIAGFIGENSIEWGSMSVLSVFSTIPVIIFALLVQRFLVEGLTLGAVKG